MTIEEIMAGYRQDADRYQREEAITPEKVVNEFLDKHLSALGAPRTSKYYGVDESMRMTPRQTEQLMPGGTIPSEQDVLSQLVGSLETGPKFGLGSVRMAEARKILDELDPTKGSIPYYAKMHQEMYPPSNQYRINTSRGVRLEEPRIYMNQAIHKMPDELDESYIRGTLGDYYPSRSWDQPAGFITPGGATPPTQVGFGHRAGSHQEGMEYLLQAEKLPNDFENSFSKYHSLWYDNPMRMQDVYDLPESLTDTRLNRYATSRVGGHALIPSTATPESLDVLYRVMGRPQGPVAVAIPDKIKKVIADRRAGGFDPKRYGTYNVSLEGKTLSQLLENYFSNYAEDVHPLLRSIKREVNRR